jgi:hypothetical protein
MLMSVEQSVKCSAVETKVLGGNLPQFRFVHHKSHKSRRGGKPANNSLSYGTATVPN